MKSEFDFDLFINSIVFFCIFCALVVYANYYNLALDISRACVLFISNFVDKPNFYVYLSANHSYERDFLHTFPTLFNSLCAILISIVAYCEYFIQKKFYWSYFVAIIVWIFHSITNPHYILYYSAAYCIAFCLALCEIKILYALQFYIHTKNLDA